VVNHNLASINLYEIRPGDRMLQFSSINFDMAVEEIFPTLMGGATLVFRPIEMLSTTDFVHWLEDEAVTILDLSTAFWHEWVKTLTAGGLKPPRTVRLVILGGESASSAAYAVWHTLAGRQVRLVNTNGPTEATVIATAYDPAQDPTFRPGDELLIGRPIENTRIYLLDAEGQVTALGVPGEVYIGGPGVARGYLNLPKLTEERFVPDPFSNQPGARLYRTGDLARWRADGQLQFLGRVDDQVKIRGFRVEPGEVVAYLNQHPDVHESVVIPRGQPELRLVAYVVPRSGKTLNEVTLRQYVLEHLPAYMRPGAYVIMPSLPLTPHGKVDRRALPEPEASQLSDTRVYVPPRDELEVQLCQLWQSVLARDNISIRDDFFAMGGHSLLAVRLFALMERVLGMRLPLAAFFHAPTVAGIADLIRQQGWTRRWSSLIPLHPVGTRPPFF
jgi:aspartate racemase